MLFFYAITYFDIGEVMIDILDLPKLELGRYLTIYNYKNLLDIKTDIIELSFYIIKGEKLKIIFLNKDEIKIGGLIKEIIIRGDNNANKNKS